MIEKERITIAHTRTEERVTAIVCDSCGKRCQFLDEDAPFERGLKNVDRVTVERVLGNEHREWGDTVTEEFHICPNCWQRVLQLFKDAGFMNPTVTKVQW